MASTPNQEFAGFFDLPPELRDQIYDYCHRTCRYRNVNTPAGRPIFSFEVRAPLLKLRMVCRRTQIEYDKRSPANRHMKLSLKCFHPSWKPYDRLPRLAAMSSTLDLDLDFVHSFMSNWDSTPEYSVQEIISSALPTIIEGLPHVKDVRVYMHFEEYYCNWIQRIVRSMVRFDDTFEETQSTYPRIQHLKAISVVWDTLDGFRDVQLTKWTSEDGLSFNPAALHTHRKDCARYDWCRQEHCNADDMPLTATDLKAARDRDADDW